MQQAQSKKLPKQEVPLMELLACNATAKSRSLLKKHGKPDAKNYDDLQNKLSDLYSTSKDKVEIEKAFAEIHPHKDFILKYLSPEPAKTKVIIQEPLSSVEGTKEITEPFIKNDKFLITVSAVAIVAIVALVIYKK